MGDIIISTQDELSGHEVTEILGLVQGNTVRARHVGRDIMAGLKNVVGGEIGSYTDLMTEARQEAIARMVEQAEAKGADAIVAVRFTTANIMSAAAELFVYGTAIKVRKS